jgi:hypothetical protein
MSKIVFGCLVGEAVARSEAGAVTQPVVHRDPGDAALLLIHEMQRHGIGFAVTEDVVFVIKRV